MNQKETVKQPVRRDTHAKTVQLEEYLTPTNIILPALVIIAIIMVLFIFAFVERKKIVADVEQVTYKTAEYVSKNIENEIDFAKSSIKLSAFTAAQAMTSDSLDNPSEVIAPLVEATPFASIEYIRADGMNVMNIGTPFDASDREYYKEGIKGNTGVWNNYHPKTSKDTLINFYTPLIYDGKISGVITGYIEANKQLAPLFGRTIYDQKIYGALIDENEMVVCSNIETEYVKDLSLQMLIEQFNIPNKSKWDIYDLVGKAKNSIVSYKDANGEGKICVVDVPDVHWKVAILVPASSFRAILSENLSDCISTIFVVSLILILYAVFVLQKGMEKRREIAIENERLEKENRIYNEENKKAFDRIAEISDIIASAEMGTWRIELVDGQEPRMYNDETMKAIMGFEEDDDSSPEKTYFDWFNNITPEAVDSVLKSVNRMQQGFYDENTYLWNHPKKGPRYVRCGGTALEIDGGFLLRGYHYDVDDVVREDMAKVEMLRATLDKKNEFDSVLRHLGGIFYSMHVIDLVNDTFTAFSAHNIVKEMGEVPKDAAQTMKKVMYATITDEYLEEALRFTDLTTVAKRMGNKKNISRQFLGKNIGWILADFITVEEDEKRRPTKVIFTTRNIDEEKRREEELVEWSSTDELTGLLNRRAYEEELNEIDANPNKEFVYVSIDANGLKVINDSLGHLAGDEMLRGVCECMTKTLGYYGNLYRTGGDEFVAILRCNAEKAENLLSDFEDALLNWSGEEVKKISASYGFISTKEKPGLSTRELAAVADERMYESKANHYKKLGIDRRGQKDAHKALCDLFTKILKINITDDTYQIIDMDFEEQTEEKGFADTISAWLKGFGEKGYVHPNDLDSYLKYTDIKYMSEYFASNKTSLHIFYRRKYGDVYKRVMMEIIPANDYANDNQSLFLYVKDIDR